MTDRTLKLAILRSLNSGRHEYKFNLIGKGHHPGSLERQLGCSFSAEERHRAVTAFDDLKRAGMIRPSYTDLMDPENWVEITEAGTQALQRGEVDALEAALGKISSHLAELRAGAWAASVSKAPDGPRQASHSARELIDQILKLGAPDSAVRAMDGFVADPSSATGITRRHRFRYLMHVNKTAYSESALQVAERACDLLLAIDNRLKGLAHSRDPVASADARDAVEAAELALRHLLLPDDGAA